jgi:hypothetical protein
LRVKSSPPRAAGEPGTAAGALAFDGADVVGDELQAASVAMSGTDMILSFMVFKVIQVE